MTATHHNIMKPLNRLITKSILPKIRFLRILGYHFIILLFLLLSLPTNGENTTQPNVKMPTKTIYFAGGCFWGVEKYFSLIPGVTGTETGYANGKTSNPTYQEVCKGDIGHAETVRVTYNPDIISLPFLLEQYYQVIDPTSVNKQGNDEGVQYRTGIYYTDPADKPIIDQSLAELQKKFFRTLAIEVSPLHQFAKAEEYHQNYLDKNPAGYCHIPPAKFEQAQQAKEIKIPLSIYHKKSQDELKKLLTPIQYKVTQENATETPFQNEYYNNKKVGIYVDITTGEPLFISSDQFDSDCGWPSFSRPIAPQLVAERTDNTQGMIRTEVRSKSGDAHLGHVFNDGPTEKGGLRYCINSASLRFIPRDEMEQRGYGKYLPLLDKNKN